MLFRHCHCWAGHCISWLALQCYPDVEIWRNARRWTNHYVRSFLQRWDSCSFSGQYAGRSMCHAWGHWIYSSVWFHASAWPGCSALSCTFCVLLVWSKRDAACGMSFWGDVVVHGWSEMFQERPVSIDIIVCEVGWELFWEVEHVLFDVVPFGFGVDVNFPEHLFVELWSNGSVNNDNIVVWDTKNHGVMFHKAGSDGASEVQDVLRVSGFMLDPGEVVHGLPVLPESTHVVVSCSLGVLRQCSRQCVPFWSHRLGWLQHSGCF